MFLFINHKSIGSFFEQVLSVKEKSYRNKQEILKKKEEEKLQLKEERYHKMKEIEDWQRLDEENNPDEWRVLPYGWSPFGIYI